jgi:hypothetical protein
MTRLAGRVGRLERADDSCSTCGWPDNGIELHVVEEVVTGVEEASGVKPDDDWWRPCPECGHTPFVEEIVQIDAGNPDGGPDVEVVEGRPDATGGTFPGGGIPQKR